MRTRQQHCHLRQKSGLAPVAEGFAEKALGTGQGSSVRMSESWMLCAREAWVVD